MIPAVDRNAHHYVIGTGIPSEQHLPSREHDHERRGQTERRQVGYALADHFWQGQVDTVRCGARNGRSWKVGGKFEIGRHARQVGAGGVKVGLGLRAGEPFLLPGSVFGVANRATGLGCSCRAIRTQAGADRRAGVRVVMLDGRTAIVARETAQRHGTSLFVYLLSCFGRAVAGQFGQDRFAIGTSVANRPTLDVQRTVGMFVNTVAIPFDATAGDLGAILRSTHVAASRAFGAQHVPFALLVKAINPPRTTNSTPIYQVTLSFDDAPLPRCRFGTAEVEVVELQSGFAKVDLSFVAVPQREQRLLYGEGGGCDEIKLIVQYRAATVAEDEVQAVMSNFLALLSHLGSDDAGPAAVGISDGNARG